MAEFDVIPIDGAIKDFRNHLDYNDRVIFSAKFGDGKTYFLNRFKKEYQNEYLFITIYPVNYQVEANKDIFELIKRDILFQLSKKGLITDKIDVRAIVKAAFNKSSIDELIEFLTGLATLSGIPGANLISKLATKFYKIKSCYDADKKTVNKYLNQFNENPGIYELDCYTQLITQIIESYAKKESKKIVFIIEDLDRIDPVHVFRILNIFSAHMDRNFVADIEEEYAGNTLVNDEAVYEEKFNNKFCFNKIITVCHYENLKKIYAYTYGKDVDFEGYIGKFITHQHFDFSLNEIKTNYALEKICNISKINKSFIDKKIPEIKTRLQNLSIRKIRALFDNLDAQIADAEIKVFENYNVSARCPVTRLLVILRRLIGEPDVYGDVVKKIKYENPKQTIKLIDVMWGTVVPVNGQKTLYAFYTNKDSYESFQVIPKIEDGEVIGIEDVQSERNPLKAGMRKDFVEDIFDKMKIYIQ